MCILADPHESKEKHHGLKQTPTVSRGEQAQRGEDERDAGHA